MSEVAKQHPATLPDAEEALAEWLVEERIRLIPPGAEGAHGEGVEGVSMIEALGLNPDTVIQFARVVNDRAIRSTIGDSVQAAVDEDPAALEAATMVAPMTLFTMGVMIGRAVPEPEPLPDPETVEIPDTLPEGFGES